MKKCFLVSIQLFLFSLSFGQEDQKLFTFEDYINVVKSNHPVMYQASLQTDLAESTKRMARGGFDPKVEADWAQKSFDDKNYYSIGSGALKIPTWYGIDLKAGYDRTSGVFLNESDNLPRRGLWNAGISIPLGKGLVIDERRAALKRADIFASATQQEQVLMINEILFNAATAYLEWQSSEAYLSIALEGLALAEQRFNGTLSSFVNGDKPAIDTLESFISFQSREMDYLKSIQEIENAKLQVENYLWIEGDIPLELEEEVSPEPLNIYILQEEMDSMILQQDERLLNHPELLIYDFKLANLDLDLRLAKEEIKPDLRVNYNPLLAVGDNQLFDGFNANDYKLGASFSYPIFQRKQRGKIQINKIKTETTLYDKSLKSQELNVKLNTYVNNINQVLQQYELQNLTLENTNSMLKAENQKLRAGESSIFLVNSRERKYLESQYKLIESARKLIFNKFTYLLFSAGWQ